MTLRMAVAGLRHNHILAVTALAQKTDGVELVACAESHGATREAMADKLTVTHDDPVRMLDEVDCDIVAVGDYYARRGSLVLEALRRGRHVLSDKPLATSLDELEQIESLARERGLAVGCQFDLTDTPAFVRLRELVRNGTLGEVHQIAFGGQHPLMYGRRPGWYFEQGKHGGTINDIAVHAFHLIPWLTGLTWTRLVAARTWNAFANETSHFNDAAQCMLTLSNGAGVIGDVSYAMPGVVGYKLPQYWRFTVFGTEAMAETACTVDDVTLVRRDAKEAETLPGLAPTEPSYFESFLHEVRGEHDQAAITTADVLRASAVALKAQAAADAAGPSVGVPV